MNGIGRKGNSSNSKPGDGPNSRLFNSFRKLSGQDESSLYSSSSSSDRVGVGGAGSASDLAPPPIGSPIPPPQPFNPKPRLGKLERKKRSAWKETKEEVCQRAALYIYYDGSMRLLLLLDPESESDPGLIRSLVS